MAITLAGQLSSAFAAENFAGPVTSALLAAGVPIPENILRTISLLLITVVLAYFNLIFGELVPKRVAMKRAESLSLALSGLLYFVAKCFAPLVFLLSVSTNGVLRLMGLNPEEDDEAISEEEIRMLLATRKGSVPLDRDFGLSWDYVDMPMSEAMPYMVAEIGRQLERHVPRIRVRDISFSSDDAVDGRLIPRVTVEIREAYRDDFDEF